MKIAIKWVSGLLPFVMMAQRMQLGYVYALGQTIPMRDGISPFKVILFKFSFR